MTGDSTRNSFSNDSTNSEIADVVPTAFEGVHRTTTSTSRMSNLQRTTSVVESIREKIFGVQNEEDTADANLENYTEKSIYEDLNDEQINLKRTQSRAAIINTLEGRIAEEQSMLENDEEVEIGLIRTKTNYTNADREEALPTSNDGLEFQAIDPELVTWESEEDIQNPRNWSIKRKWRSVLVVTLYTLLSPFASTMLSPAVSVIATEFRITNVTISALMVSVYVLAWALFPPFVAPLSEMYGRKIVLDISVWGLLAFNIGCALSNNATQMCIFRLLAGAFGCAPICIGAGVLGDVFDNNERGFAMSLYSLGPTIGPCASALIAGFIVDHVSWRWCFWVLCIFNGVIAVFGNFLLEETYVPTLLTRKAAKLRKQTGNQNLHSLYEIATGETTFEKFYTNLTRPISLLFQHPMVLGLGTFMAICYGCLYILIVVFPTVWGVEYGFSKSSSGLMYVAILIGYLLGTAATQRIADSIYNRLTAKNGGVSKPEYRLPLLLQSGVLIAVGLFWFGWAAQYKMHFIFTATGSAIFGYGIIAVFYTIQNYLIEMNPRFAASSIAAASIFRSFLGFAFPLFATQMYDAIGYGWGCSIFGFIAIATGIPFPLFVILYGERLRLWANRRTEKQQAKIDARNLGRLRAKAEQEANAVSKSSAYDSS